MGAVVADAGHMSQPFDVFRNLERKQRTDGVENGLPPHVATAEHLAAPRWIRRPPHGIAARNQPVNQLPTATVRGLFR